LGRAIFGELDDPIVRELDRQGAEFLEVGAAPTKVV
jgi:hypothetical protein